jgi:predicted nucleotidyltransferase
MYNRVSNIIKDFINDTEKILKDNLVKEYLFGSYAKNTQDEFSDIDILIIVKHFNPKLRKEISSLSSSYSLNQNVIISPVIKDLNVWEKNKKYNTLFYTEIEKYGISL